MQNVFSASLNNRRVEAARRYAAFDKSDPHTFNRAMTHINNGIVNFLDEKTQAQYDADTFGVRQPVDERWAPLFALTQTREVEMTAYRNIHRP